MYTTTKSLAPRLFKSCNSLNSLRALPLATAIKACQIKYINNQFSKPFSSSTLILNPNQNSNSTSNSTSNPTPNSTSNPTSNNNVANIHASREIKTIRQILNPENQIDTKTNLTTVHVYGWVKSLRKQKAIAFINVIDGTLFEGLQVVVDNPILLVENPNLRPGVAVCISGKLQESPSKGQNYELMAQEISVLNAIDSEGYPFQKKYMTAEYTRQFPHLRPRLTTHSSIMNIRSAAEQAFHAHYARSGYIRIHTPLLTTNDCEGGGGVFSITTSPPEPEPEPERSSSSLEKPVVSTNELEFFGPKRASLTVSGQLHLEAAAHAHSRVYTLNPAFRAETGVTSRHLAEFWMLEAEQMFVFSISQLMDVVERAIVETTRQIATTCAAELEFLRKIRSDRISNKNKVKNKIKTSRSGDEKNKNKDKDILLSNDSDSSSGSSSGSEFDFDYDVFQHLDKPFARISYAEALEILRRADRDASQGNRSTKFVYGGSKLEWGNSLQTEHEAFLANEYFKGPVFVYDYPYEIKPFYMKLGSSSITSEPSTTTTTTTTSHDSDNVKRVASCFDLLVPNICELAGGSLREDDPVVLETRLNELYSQLPPPLDGESASGNGTTNDAVKSTPNRPLDWYLDLARFSSTPHGGYGIGFDRYIQFITGMRSIRDVILFPRYYNHIDA